MHLQRIPTASALLTESSSEIRRSVEGCENRLQIPSRIFVPKGSLTGHTTYILQHTESRFRTFCHAYAMHTNAKLQSIRTNTV
ncbi:hypothetical protein CEXT_202171 [Caerostris extrusa]|uniref:Uncharacterized protein n=1 Tax=Caerostris extrusa TaxID=172846 RepID=A0AAV4T0P3_CAEEX|nr:hypothetical protein CEXT_202171 [Caerostris extrusa]